MKAVDSKTDDCIYVWLFIGNKLVECLCFVFYFFVAVNV